MRERLHGQRHYKVGFYRFIWLLRTLIRDSYGHLFINAILRASSPNLWAQTPNFARTDLRNQIATSGTYAIRDPDLGINADLMSYVSYMQSRQSRPEALIDQKTLLEQSQATFSLFFKHFVNSGMSSDIGGWAFQMVGSRLVVGPRMQGYYGTYGFDSPAEPLLRHSFLPNGDPAPEFEDVPPHSIKHNGTATLTTSVEILSINTKAFWTATGILVSLICIMITFIILNQSYLGGIIRNVECIADVIVLIAGSERLWALVQDKGIETIIKEDKILTQLRWFEDADGKQRWGIELTESDDTETEVLLTE
jgi:hypothetical protein